jgi:malate dehydrogenase (oxaloacetate-decarboxylating)(NADP+)
VIRAAQQDGVDRAANLKEMDDEALDKWIISKMYDPFKQLQ